MDNKPNIDRLLESIKQSNKALLRNTDLGISQLQGIDKLKDEYRYVDNIDMLPLDSARLEIFMRHYDLGKALPPLDTLFSVLVSAQRMAPILECAPETRMGMKLYTLLLVFWVRIMANYDGEGEQARYRQAFYDKIGDLPANNLFHRIFLEAYNHDNAYGIELERRLLEEVISEIERSMKAWELALMKPRSYLKANGDMTKKLVTSQDITTFIETINAVHTVLKDPEAPKETKACLMWWFTTRIWQIVHYNESRISEEFFNRRNEIDRDNILRNYVVSYYLTKKAMDSYEKAIDSGDRSRNYKELEGELYRQFGEEAVSGWSNEEEDRKCKEMLPDDIKKSLDDQEAEIVGKMAKITEVVNKVKNFKTEGKTDEEVLAFLTAAEKEARMLSKGTTPPTPQVNL